MKTLMMTFWIALAVTLLCGWLFLDLLTSFDGLAALLLAAIVIAVLITLLRMLHQRVSDLQRRVEALEEAVETGDLARED